MTSWLKWGIIILAMGVDFYFSFKMLKSEENEQKEYFLQKSIRYAYSCAHELMENKRYNNIGVRQCVQRRACNPTGGTPVK